MTHTSPTADNQAALSQWFTPRWAADALREQFLPLEAGEIACDPTCGDGSMLSAIPPEFQAFGVEIDPRIAELARENTGRLIVTGDFRTVAIPQRPTLFYGNPPFDSAVVSGIVSRCFELLPWEGRLAMILPCYVFQTSTAVIDYHSRWSIDAKMLPRNLFPRLSLPLLFVQMRKTHQRFLTGFALYEPTHDVQGMPAAVRECLGQSRGSVWYEAVDQVLLQLGGEGTLDMIYASMEPKRPTQNQHWREKTRQILQQRFDRVGTGRYRRRCADTTSRVAA